MDRVEQLRLRDWPEGAGTPALEDLAPSGMRDRELLFIRELVVRARPVEVPDAVGAAVAAARMRALRPIGGQVPAYADVVLFRDDVEARAACLVAFARRGERPWWSRHLPSPGQTAAAVLLETTSTAAVVRRLVGWRQLTTALEGLDEAALLAVVRHVADRHGLRATSPGAASHDGGGSAAPEEVVVHRGAAVVLAAPLRRTALVGLLAELSAAVLGRLDTAGGRGAASPPPHRPSPAPRSPPMRAARWASRQDPARSAAGSTSGAGGPGKSTGGDPVSGGWPGAARGAGSGSPVSGSAGGTRVPVTGASTPQRAARADSMPASSGRAGSRPPLDAEAAASGPARPSTARPAEEHDPGTPCGLVPADRVEHTAVRVDSAIAGALYLVNPLVSIDIDTWSLSAAPPWEVLAGIGRALLGGDDDPLWALLGAFADRPVGRPPDPDVVEAAPALARSIAASLHLEPGDLAALLRVPGTVTVDDAHLDVVFPLAAIDVETRRRGLDRDPGWVPGLGRIIAFSYEDRWL